MAGRSSLIWEEMNMNIIGELIHKVEEEFHKGVEDLEILTDYEKKDKKQDLLSENLAIPEIRVRKAQAQKEGLQEAAHKTPDVKPAAAGTMEEPEKTKKPTISIHSLAMPEIHLKKQGKKEGQSL